MNNFENILSHFQARDNGQLSQLLAEQSSKLEALETAADRHSFQEIDTTQLLQTMQSDKIAAARALSQNKQLKEQLEELQNGFIMMVREHYFGRSFHRLCD